MTLKIELTPEDEAKLCSAARVRGLDPSELARKLDFENLPPVPETGAFEPPDKDATIALIQQWIDEDATDDPEEIAAAERELEEFKAAMNAERVRAGARLLYP